MKSHTNEQGSAAHIVIITVLVVAVLGLLGFVFWQNFIKEEAPQQTATQTTTTVEKVVQAEPSIEITEWGLKAEYDKEVLGALSYIITGDTLTFSSSSVNNDVLPCAGLSSSSWGISRAQAGEKDIYGVDVAESWEKIGDSYYNRVYPSGGCEDKVEEITAIDTEYKALFNSLTASN
jgi:hypothetical protein